MTMYCKALHFNLTDFTLSEFSGYKLRKQNKKVKFEGTFGNTGKIGSIQFLKLLNYAPLAQLSRPEISWPKYESISFSNLFRKKIIRFTETSQR